MNKKLDDKDLVKVTGGFDQHDEQVLDIRKDLYENIILAVNPEEHNVMVGGTPEK